MNHYEYDRQAAEFERHAIQLSAIERSGKWVRLLYSFAALAVLAIVVYTVPVTIFLLAAILVVLLVKR